MGNTQVSPPNFAVMLLAWILPASILDCVLGDLLEEFYQRAAQDERAAKNWFWHQTIQTSVIYARQLFNSLRFIQGLNIAVALTLFIIAFALIAWLSHAYDLDGYSNGFWQTLLTGQAHMALIEGSFWTSLIDNVSQIDTIWFLIDLPSIIISSLSISLLLFLDRKSALTPFKLACYGYALVLLPYLWSIIHINNNHFIATQIGPIMAIGLISFLYMILPVGYLVNRKLLQSNNAEQGDQ